MERSAKRPTEEVKGSPKGIIKGKYHGKKKNKQKRSKNTMNGVFKNKKEIRRECWALSCLGKSKRPTNELTSDNMGEVEIFHVLQGKNKLLQDPELYVALLNLTIHAKMMKSVVLFFRETFKIKQETVVDKDEEDKDDSDCNSFPNDL